MSRTTVFVALLSALALLAVILSGCSELADPLERQGGPSENCVSCHTDQALLVSTAEPDSSNGEEPEGEG